MTQRQMILKHLHAGRTLTAIEALQHFGCFRLAARIDELRDEGHDIETTMQPTVTGKSVAEYRLRRKQAAA